MLTPNQLRQRYLEFFEKNGHAIIPSSPIVPENDPTTLFTGSGMQPMVPYLLGEKHPKGTRIVDSQKCFRSQDIEEVGDNRHTTFFEMLGNWSLGDYFKKEQLRWFFEFLTKEIGLDHHKLFVTVFTGSDELGIPRDTESVEIWKTLFSEVGIEAKDIDHAEKDGMQDGRIFYYSEKKNWWSRSGVPANMPAGEPGGPDSEVFYDFGADRKLHENSAFKNQPCHVNCDCGRFLEIGNSVFMQYQKQDDGSFKELAQKNVDFGGGFERILAVQINNPDVFMTELFQPIIQKIEQLSGQKYTDHSFAMRVIADHVRAATMLAVDNVYPSNKEQGYFARRLLRRAIRFGRQLGVMKPFLSEVAEVVAEGFVTPYPDVKKKLSTIQQVFNDEEQKFLKTVDKGLKALQDVVQTHSQEKPPVGKELAEIAFDLYQTYGLPVDIAWEEFQKQFTGRIYKPEEKEDYVKAFDELRQKHSDQSRTASSGMFKGGLADHSEVTTKYHTATHLLHAALRKVLGTHVQQKGSNITAERLRFDFSHPSPMTAEQQQEVEKIINDWIAQDLPVTMKLMQKQDALKSGAIAFFLEKYPDEVSVYTVGKDPETDWISKEFCGGPHVTSTGVIGPIKLTKEQSASASIRRVYMELSK